jgi:uncharacterized protein
MVGIVVGNLAMSKPEFNGLAIRVMPNARANRVEQADDGSLRLRLQAPAVEGKANDALLRFVAGRLDVSRNCVSLLSGEHNRSKVIAVTGWTPESIREKLLAGEG